MCVCVEEDEGRRGEVETVGTASDSASENRKSSLTAGETATGQLPALPTVTIVLTVRSNPLHSVSPAGPRK